MVVWAVTATAPSVEDDCSRVEMTVAVLLLELLLPLDEVVLGSDCWVVVCASAGSAIFASRIEVTLVFVSSSNCSCWLLWDEFSSMAGDGDDDGSRGCAGCERSVRASGCSLVSELVPNWLMLLLASSSLAGTVDVTALLVVTFSSIAILSTTLAAEVAKLCGSLTVS
uniref:(northern house mosquito) hypothetical protein n=1 Tax=Culex pipiens TaxID=7175 RepID=A0A8D8HXJ2_CULPI